MKKTLTKLRYQLARVFTRHQAFVVLIAALLVSSAVVLRFISISNQELDQEMIDNEVRSTQTIQFSEEAIEKIEALRDSNVKEPGTQVQNNRDNPFSE